MLGLRYFPPYGIIRKENIIHFYVSCRSSNYQTFPTEKEAIIFEGVYNILAEDALKLVKQHLKEKKIPQKSSLAHFVLSDPKNAPYPTKYSVADKTYKIVKKLKSLDCI